MSCLMPARRSAGFVLAVIFAWGQVVVAADMPHTTPPQKKEFTLVSHYHYVERAYTPSVIITRISEEPAVPPNYAEQELISQFSAIDALDFDWWLKTWDGPSAQKILDRMSIGKVSDKDWKAQWSPKAGKTRVTLTRWLLTGEYVILVYKITPEETKASVESAAKQKSPAVITNVTETATAFHLWNGRWHATLDLEADPVFLHFADAKNVFEQVVRP
jgi:hypothetical protein